MWVFGWWAHVISYLPNKFSVHKICGIGDITFFICHEPTYDHTVKESYDYVCDGPVSSAITLISLVAMNFRDRNRDIIFFYLSHKYWVMWPLWLVTLSHHAVKFSGHKPSGSGNIIFFTYHVTSGHHMIERSCDFMFCGLLSEATIFSS